MNKYLIILVSSILVCGCNPFSKKRAEFIDNFDLELTGRVIGIKLNKYKQKIVCLKVLDSNYNNYFPIYNPTNLEDSITSNEDKRFFIKVEGENAIIIYRDKFDYTYITKFIKENAIIKINEENNKSFNIYDSSGVESFGGLKIQTSPLRDNVEISCLGKNL